MANYLIANMFGLLKIICTIVDNRRIRNGYIFDAAPINGKLRNVKTVTQRSDKIEYQKLLISQLIKRIINANQ